MRCRANSTLGRRILRLATVPLVLTLAALAASACGSEDMAVDPVTTTGTTATTIASTATPSTEAPTDDTIVEPTVEATVPEALPDGPADLAAALTEAEQQVRNTDLTPPVRHHWGTRQQALYRHLSFHPDWYDDTVANLGPDVRPVFDLNWEARRNLEALLATEKLHDTMPAWTVVEPEPAAELIGYYQEAEAATGIEWEYVAAINLVETRMGRIQGVSTAGAVGPMQFLPTTWAECCEGDPTNPRDAIIGAATYLTHRGGPDNMAKAIWGYNNSDFYVNAVTAYAQVLMADEQAYHGYHGWGIYFLTTEGLVSIPVGYQQQVEIPVTDWLADNPQALISG